MTSDTPIASHGVSSARVRTSWDSKPSQGIDCVVDGVIPDTLVKPHMTLGGETPAVLAGISLPNGFRWKAILEAAITREVTVAASEEGQTKSPD